MNALTNAVNFLSAFSDKLENQTEISDLVLKVAAKFNNWILNAALPSGKPLTTENVNDAVDDIRSQLGHQPYRDNDSGRTTTVHQSDRNALPVTKKQRGYLIGLLKEAGSDFSYEEIDELDVGAASAWIDSLLHDSGGNGKRPGNGVPLF